MRRTDFVGTALPSVTQFSYDLSGRLGCTAVRMNPSLFAALPASACVQSGFGAYGPDRIRFDEYDAVDRLVRTTDGVGTSTQRLVLSQGWTPNDKLDWIEDGRGNRSDHAYDGFDRLQRLSFPPQAVGAHAANPSDYEEYGYDPAGNPVTKRTRDGRLWITTFDALNRIAAIDAPAGTNDVVYGHDNLDRRLSAGHPGGTTITATWDALGRRTAETGPLGPVSSQYDLADRRTRLTWPDGVFVTYDYDLDDAMTGIWLAGTTPIVTYAHDDLGRRTWATRSNGVTTRYSWDGASRLSGLSHDLAGTAGDIAYGYTHNAAGQIMQQSRSNTAYAYAGLLAGTTAYGINGLNQATSAGGTALAWSPNGNLTNDGTRVFAYDAANRLTGTGASVLSYDPLDRLSRQQGASDQRYVHDGPAIIGIATGGTAISQRFIPGAWTDEVVGDIAAGGKVSLWLQDHQGSTLAITAATGTAAAINRYDDYGLPQAGNAGALQYTGQLWLPEFGVHHYKARAYHPVLGRFMQTDPVGYEEGMNLYAYVANDPVNGTDPTGMIGCPADAKPGDCVDDNTAPQPGPDEETTQVDDVVVTARSERRFTSGEPIRFPATGDLEQGFRASPDGIFPVPFSRSGTQQCSDGTSRRANAINRAGIGDNSGGHTHGGGELNPLPGPEDGAMAAATGRTAYQMSSRGAFAIENTASGYRVRRLSGRSLSGSEQGELRGLIRNWNQNNGGSGATCTFTPD